MQKPMLFRILHKINHLLKPHAFTVQKNPDMYHCMIVSYMTECVSIKGFKQSLLLCFCLSDVEVRSQLSKKINFDTCQTRSVVVSDGLLPTSVSGHITSFPTFICMWDWHFAALHYVTKDIVKKTSFFFFSTVLILVLNQFLLLALSWLALGCQLKKANKPARNLPVPATDWDLTRHQWNMLIAMDIPSARIPKVVLLPIRLAVA